VLLCGKLLCVSQGKDLAVLGALGQRGWLVMVYVTVVYN